MAPPEHLWDLLSYLHASPSPFHAVAEAGDRLAAAGFTELDPTQFWPKGPQAAFLRRGGMLVAWIDPGGPPVGFRIIGAHTDSPNLRIKPRPDRTATGARQLAVEVYGGVLLSSWLDRDLGLSGRALVRAEDGSTVERLFRSDRPLLRIPQLAIHLDREVNERGLVLNRQTQLSPLWGTGASAPRGFRDLVAELLCVEPDAIRTVDAMCHDVAEPSLVGADGDLLSAARIDNLVSCHAAVTALARCRLRERPPGTVPLVALFDHEEVGSVTDRGAAGELLSTTLERLVASCGGDRGDHLRALAASHCVSADGAHATHPNYPERHEPGHPVEMNQGPALKSNASARYATDAASAVPVLDAAEAAGVPLQWFVTRGDLPCGSTIGPLIAARLGVPTVDLGVPQLAMHSCRELAGAHDPSRLADLLTAYLCG